MKVKHPPKTRQDELLSFVDDFIEERGYSPSYSEMCEGIGLKSKGSIYNLIQQLRESGRLEAQPACARTIRVVHRV